MNQPYNLTVVRMGKVQHPIQSTPTPRVRACKPVRVVAAKAVPRTYYAKRLLEHGALQFKELVEITGWDGRCISRVLEHLRAAGIATFNGREWELVE